MVENRISSPIHYNLARGQLYVKKGDEMLLQEEIERKRKEMIDCAQQYGISSHLTISKAKS